MWLDLTAMLARTSTSRKHIPQGYLQAVVDLFYCCGIELLAGTTIKRHVLATLNITYLLRID
jgi:hypothetical protein